MTILHSIFTKPTSTRRASLGMGAVVASLLLSACAEPEVILPGVRQDVRSVLQGNDGFTAPADLPVPANTTRAISLPAATANSSWLQSSGTPSTRVSHPALGAAPRLAWSAGIGNGDSRKRLYD